MRVYKIGSEELYCLIFRCTGCRKTFVTSYYTMPMPQFCPNCGRQIAAILESEKKREKYYPSPKKQPVWQVESRSRFVNRDGSIDYFEWEAIDHARKYYTDAKSALAALRKLQASERRDQADYLEHFGKPNWYTVEYRLTRVHE